MVKISTIQSQGDFEDIIKTFQISCVGIVFNMNLWIKLLKHLLFIHLFNADWFDAQYGEWCSLLS